MNYDIKAVIFDLDGTLVNSLADLAGAANHVLAEAGYPVHPVEAYRYFVGNGLDVLLRRALPGGQPSTQEAYAALLERVRQRYDTHWHDKTVPYPGMAGLLAELVRRGLPIMVLSNKPDPWVAPCVRYFFPEVRFDIVRGALPDVPRKPDPQAAQALAMQAGVAPENVAFVGDSNVDMRTAVNAGMAAFGATWGFRERDELLAAGAGVLLERPDDLLKWVQKTA
ncbi:MAG TPA: HAD-IA family hydrolase [Candidatus Avidesulfovibrio excrementigallinarum]|nr:HAD-IA family hydrolase [Candidatus Avidesulfovibrio excrementigallinarum]